MTRSIWLDRAYSRTARQLGERALGSFPPGAAEFARGGPFLRSAALDLFPRGGGNAADAKRYPIVFDILLPIDEGLGSTSSRERRRCRVRSHTCTTGRLFSS